MLLEDSGEDSGFLHFCFLRIREDSGFTYTFALEDSGFRNFEDSGFLHFHDLRIPRIQDSGTLTFLLSDTQDLQPRTTGRTIRNLLVLRFFNLLT